MSTNETTWEIYKAHELARVTPLLQETGFVLDEKQPHLSGERHLMQAVTTEAGRKLVLLGARISDGMRVVIKATSNPAGARELEHERVCRLALQKLMFAYQGFLSPEEILFMRKDGCTLFIQKFLEQDTPFMERPTEEQFMFALKAFKAQESAHATTFAHRRFAVRTFGERSAQDYQRFFAGFQNDIHAALPSETTLQGLLTRAAMFLRDNARTIEQYGGFLTHTDFVPHNFRIIGTEMYLLDHSSLRFANKYEGWARFTNFMLLYNPALEEALVRYVRDNRTPEESLSFKLMRVYRLGEIIRYYAGTLEKSSGMLQELNSARVRLWTRALECILADKVLPEEERRAYIEKRDVLRSEEEKERQKGLH